MMGRTRDRRRCILTWGLLLFCFGVHGLEADPTLITRVYLLKNHDPAIAIRVINFSIANPTGKRILSCREKELVVTDAIDQQDEIAELLPIIDQPGKETEPRRIQMEMIVR